jgi:hypothetical protein
MSGFPQLIDYNARLFMNSILHKCHDNRIYLYSIALNVGVFVIFVLVFGLALYYCYTKKPNEYERREKMIKDQEYILSKIRFYQSELANKKQSSITELPLM